MTADSTRSNRKTRKDRKEQKGGPKNQVKNIYSIPQLNIEDASKLKKQDISNADLSSRNKQGMDDFMLQDLTDIQKEYVIKELYPTLKQSIMHVSSIVNFYFLLFYFHLVYSKIYAN